MTDHQHNPQPGQNGWTFVSLKAYLEGLIIANDRRYEQRFMDSQTAVAAALAAVKLGADAALVAQKEAANKAEQASERRFEQARIEADQRMSELSRQISKLEGVDREASGRRFGTKEAWGYIIAILTLIAAIVFRK
jgi:hypothetical protein